MTRPEAAAPPETLDDDPPVTGLLSPHLVGITPDSSLSTGLRLTATTGFRHLPVLDGQRCVGMVTETDLARFVADGAGTGGLRAAAVRVADLMRTAPTIPASGRRSHAALSMRTERGDAVLVTDRGRLVGIVTGTDLVRSLAGFPAAGGHGPGAAS
jgi:CBS domain-containing protein